MAKKNKTKKAPETREQKLVRLLNEARDVEESVAKGAVGAVMDDENEDEPYRRPEPCAHECRGKCLECVRERIATERLRVGAHDDRDCDEELIRELRRSGRWRCDL